MEQSILGSYDYPMHNYETDDERLLQLAEMAGWTPAQDLGSFIQVLLDRYGGTVVDALIDGAFNEYL